MAYADQKMSGNRVTALIVVAILHVIVGYALVTGLAYEAFQKVKERVETFDVKEEKPPEEPPPPPPDQPLPPPPIVAPPPPISFTRPAPVLETVVTPPPPAPVFTTAAPAPPPPPPVASKARGAKPKGQGSWAARIQDNYPSAALRKEIEGTVGVRVTVGPDGRVSGCTVSSGSGSGDLDSAACDGMTRYARFDPALDAAGNPTSGSFSTRIVYKIN
ncbi:MAG: TonB family protein [Stagnimonas sp.]|nr:TonB family protein [Stagnimonas sp.]